MERTFNEESRIVAALLLNALSSWTLRWAIDEWRKKVENYEDDLQDSTLRGDTRAGIRNMLNAAYAMVAELEQQKADLERHVIDRDSVNAEYEKVLDWCKQVKSERQELTYTQQRDFLYMLGVTVLVYRQEKQGADPTWDIRVACRKSRKSCTRDLTALLEILLPEIGACQHLLGAFH